MWMRGYANYQGQAEMGTACELPAFFEAEDEPASPVAADETLAVQANTPTTTPEPRELLPMPPSPSSLGGYFSGSTLSCLHN